jgi:hypothetical protein
MTMPQNNRIQGGLGLPAVVPAVDDTGTGPDAEITTGARSTPCDSPDIPASRTIGVQGDSITAPRNPTRSSCQHGAGNSHSSG